MKNEVLARRYAEALRALSQDRAHTVDERLTRVAEALKTPDAQLIMSHPTIPPEDKKALLAELSGETDGPLRQFMAVVVDHRRADLIPEIAELFHRAVLAAEGRTEAVIETARALVLPDQERTVDALGQLLGLTLAPRFVVEPELIGGVRAYVGDRMVDGSVRGSLEQLRHRLMRGEEVGS